MTRWRVWRIVRREVESMVAGMAFRKAENWLACLKVLAGRLRWRKPQRLPEQAQRVFRAVAQCCGSSSRQRLRSKLCRLMPSADFAAKI